MKGREGWAKKVLGRERLEGERVGAVMGLSACESDNSMLQGTHSRMCVGIKNSFLL